MSLSIITNKAALNAAKTISSNNQSLETISQRLASGFRINSAADDPAGLAISQLIGSKIAAMMQDQQNIGQGISLAQTVDGALAQQSEIMQRLATLAAESANGVLSNSQRAATIQPEVDALLTQFDKIGASASFNGLQLLAGGSSGVTASVAAGTVANTNITSVATTNPNGTAAVRFQSDVISSGDTATLAVNAAGLMTLTWTTQTTGLVTTAVANSDIQTASSASGGTSSIQTINLYDALGSTIATATIQAGVSATVATTTDISLTLTAGTSNLFVIQSGTENNVNSQLTISVSESLRGAYGLSGLDITSQASAQAALTTITNATSTLATARASVGAVISQLNQAADFTANSLINAQQSIGQIRDVDIADASAELASQSVLVQAAMAMLSQANEQPQSILVLLKK